jgi:very-short-patch-repair endonuclease
MAIKIENPIIKCFCGCGQDMPTYAQNGKLRKYIWKHRMKRENILVKCACGCNSQFWQYNRGYKRRFILGHKIKKKNFQIECACGCGTLIWKYDYRGREAKYVYTHQNIGRKGKPEKGIRLSNALKGRYVPMSHINFMHQRMRELRNKGLLKNNGEFKKGSIPFMKGKHHTPEAIEKNRIKHFRENLSLMTLEKRKIARSKQKVPMKDSSIEIKTQSYLKALGIEFFTHQYMSKISHAYLCDILIPSMNLVIECDGMYWHKYPIGKDLDHIRTKELIEKGFKVLRLWEWEINCMGSPKELQRRLDEIKESL